MPRSHSEIGRSLRRVQWAAKDHAETDPAEEAARPAKKGPYEDTFSISIGGDDESGDE